MFGQATVGGDPDAMLELLADDFEWKHLGSSRISLGLDLRGDGAEFVENLRTAAADPQFLASVLDFVLRDDATVKAFANVSQLHPTNIAAAREVLGDPKWERDVP